MDAARETRAKLTKLRATYERMADAMVRRGETGWRFYDIQGRGFALSDSEGEELRGEAQRQIDALFRGLNGSTLWLMLWAMLAQLIGLRMADEFALAGGMPSAVYFVPVVTLLFGDAINEVRFLFAWMRWREEQAQRLRRRDGREHEAANYAWFFDPRLPRIAGFGLIVLALALTVEAVRPPPMALALVAAGLVLVGFALFPRKPAVETGTVAAAPRRRDIRGISRP